MTSYELRIFVCSSYWCSSDLATHSNSRGNVQRRIPARHAFSSRCLRFRQSRCNERLCSLHSCATIRTMPAEVLALPLLTERLPLPPSPSLDPLLDAAVECISRHGLSKTSLSDIAREMGVAPSTVSRKVGSVDNVALLVLGREAHRLLERSEEHTAET